MRRLMVLRMHRVRLRVKLVRKGTLVYPNKKPAAAGFLWC
jgi:hypothetical protein